MTAENIAAFAEVMEQIERKNRHSVPKVGNAPVSGPSRAGRRRSGLCQHPTIRPDLNFENLAPDESISASSFPPFRAYGGLVFRVALVVRYVGT